MGLVEACTWIVDLRAQSVEIARQPAPHGYRAIEEHGRGGILAPEAFPELTIAVDDILG